MLWGKPHSFVIWCNLQHTMEFSLLNCGLLPCIGHVWLVGACGQQWPKGFEIGPQNWRGETERRKTINISLYRNWNLWFNVNCDTRRHGSHQDARNLIYAHNKCTALYRTSVELKGKRAKNGQKYSLAPQSTAMRRITTFRSTTHPIYDGGPII